MELNFLGCGSAFNPNMGNTSAYFEFQGDLYLLDCGESVYERLLNRVKLLDYNHIYVLLTHLHGDHVGGLGSLISYCCCVLKKKINVIHPEHTVVELLRLMGIKDEFYDHNQTLPDAIEGIKASAILVHHVENMKCFGYLLECENQSIYYSGDASEIPESILETLRSGRLDRLYQDTSAHNSPNPSHCYVGDLERIIPMEWRKRVYCMHLDHDCRLQLLAMGFQVIQNEI